MCIVYKYMRAYLCIITIAYAGILCYTIYRQREREYKKSRNLFKNYYTTAFKKVKYKFYFKGAIFMNMKINERYFKAAINTAATIISDETTDKIQKEKMLGCIATNIKKQLEKLDYSQQYICRDYLQRYASILYKLL